MVDITVWTNDFLKVLNKNFDNRIWFVGLQGSYGRGEATENSDIDIVVILDQLSALDIQRYNEMLDALPHRNLICGFISGKSEILHWEPADLIQFYFDTSPIVGSLDELLPLIDISAIDRAIKNGVCNIYHGCVHNMLYDKSDEILKGLYKSASFVVQTIALKETGKYSRLQKELMNVVCPNERIIIEIFSDIKNGRSIDFNKMSEVLFDWAKNHIIDKK